MIYIHASEWSCIYSVFLGDSYEDSAQLASLLTGRLIPAYIHKKCLSISSGGLSELF